MRKFQQVLWFLPIFIIAFTSESKATHNRAGEITFEHIERYTYEITLITYTNPNSPPDRPTLTVEWGDGSKSEVSRDRIDKNIGKNNQHPVQKNVYKGRHSYDGPGTYTIRMRDQNRVKDIINMTNSVNTAFYVETKLSIFASGLGHNNSPVLLQPPVDYAQTNEVYVHYPNAYDVDGDSLAYSLVPPKRDFQEEVNGYYEPYAKNKFSIDSVTGRLEWDYPDSTGIYNIAIKVEEFREGNKIGEVIRDMQIIVTEGKNKRPNIVKPEFTDTCVEAGENINLNVPIKAVDTNPKQTYFPPHDVTLSATGGPFEVKKTKATFKENTESNIVNSNFSWQISCSHIRKFPYRVVFKAKDDHPVAPLADLRHLDIKVIGPEPKNLTSDPKPKGIKLDWDLPSCKNVRGFRIYRRIDTSSWNPSYCENGVPPYTGFKEIKTLPGKDKTSFFDQNVVPGAVYCYRVTGLYRNEGKHKLVEGYASNETCARLKKDVPVITHVDVRKTSENEGTIFIDWTKPEEVDSNTYEPPYKYEIYHSTNLRGGPSEKVKTVDSIPSYQALVSNTADTIFYDSALNTKKNPYSYNIKFYGSSDSSEVFIGSSRVNSSVYLNIRPDHKSLILSWNENVLWKNREYVIFRKHYDSGQYRIYDTTKKQRYPDTNLVKDSTYCYYVKSIGAFTAPGFPKPIINHSQKSCEEPIDTIAPCPPEIDGQSVCNIKENHLQWNKPFCEKDSSVVGYKVYFRNHKGKSFQLLSAINTGDKTDYEDQRDTLNYSLAGCYAVSAVDPYGNESRLSNFICVDNCPRYRLPNTFTPNGDGKNDFFRPYPDWQFVKRINLKIFNRWGNLVYKTSDPDFKWDGTDYESGKKLSPGTYYYEIEIFQIYLDGLQSESQSGTIKMIH